METEAETNRIVELPRATETPDQVLLNNEDLVLFGTIFFLF
jgi:hypothetical protein